MRLIEFLVGFIQNATVHNFEKQKKEKLEKSEYLAVMAVILFGKTVLLALHFLALSRNLSNFRHRSSCTNCVRLVMMSMPNSK